MINKNVIHLYLWRLFCLILATFGIIFFWENTGLISLLLFILACLINLKSQKFEVIYFIVISILATFLESLTMSTGAWTYSQQHILNFPIWIPLYWGMGGIVIKDLYFIIKNLVENK